ncbi:GOLPH3/VPS74 family protein [Actinoplanes subglobosus]|uniref:GPP34 family phosphoprotein n=1 Tax=Actinoplanes subglobosus TaxID=1547892 RepID=A0ABV8IRY2_9ACTN
MNLLDDLVLLAYDDEGGTWTIGDYLDYGVAAAALLELTRAGRLGFAAGTLTVTDGTPTGDPVLDDVLGRIAAEPGRRAPSAWIPVLSRGARQPILDRMVAAGMLGEERSRVLGVFSRTHYPAIGATPALRAGLRHRLRAAVDGTEEAVPGTAALCALAGALGWHRQLFPDLPPSIVEARLREIGSGQWAGTAAGEALTEVRLAVMVALTAVAVATGAD